MNSKLPITIAILLGGQSNRFGSPKAYLHWKGKSLAAHMAQSALALAEEILFVGKNADQIPPDARDLCSFLTDLPNFPGPLGGLAAALEESNFPWVFLTGVDMPYLNEKVLGGLWSLCEQSTGLDAVVPYLDNRWQPLCALWGKSSQSKLSSAPWKSFQQYLNEGGLQIARAEEILLRSWDADLSCLKGFNTKEEFKQLATDEHR